MKKKPLSLEEQKEIRYEILVEVDKFCRERGINYSLAFGTLLGAVRHHGFIPWDDDLDIMMPLPDLLRLKNEFHSNKIRYCDIDTDSNYRFAFGNMGYNRTYRKNGLIGTFFGVGVDVQPFIGIPSDKNEQDKFFKDVERLAINRDFFVKWHLRALKMLPICNIPGYTNAVRKHRDYLFYNSVPYKNANTFYVLALPLDEREKCTFNIDLFDEYEDLKFEGGAFKCIKKYDYFLSQMYGDYMKLPPQEERIPHHGQSYYWK